MSYKGSVVSLSTKLGSEFSVIKAPATLIVLEYVNATYPQSVA
jgi:hypothetical protein